MTLKIKSDKTKSSNSKPPDMICLFVSGLSPDLQSMEQIRRIMRPTDVPDTGRFNPFMHKIIKWPNILKKSCSVYTARFLKYVGPFYNIMHERVIIMITITWT